VRISSSPKKKGKVALDRVTIEHYPFPIEEGSRNYFQIIEKGRDKSFVKIKVSSTHICNLFNANAGPTLFDYLRRTTEDYS